MPRNKSLLQAGQQPQRSQQKTNKITIRPYEKPPSLPANYYQATVQPLLEGTLCVARQQTPALSLQNAYTAVVTLVRHQYGPQLYADWIRSMHGAVNAIVHAGLHPALNLLQLIPQLYKQFTEYLTVCRHIFLPLDRTHVWNGLQGVPLQAPCKNPLTLWTAALAAFRQRLHHLQLEMPLYHQWLQALLQDWTSACAGRPQLPVLANTSWEGDRTQLQAVWYLWQDLGMLVQPSPLPLQQDLEQYWLKRSELEWEDCQGSAVLFLTLALQHHQHVTLWPWLPVQWLWHVIDTHYLQPLWKTLLQQNQFAPLVLAESKIAATPTAVTSTPASTTTTTLEPQLSMSITSESRLINHPSTPATMTATNATPTGEQLTPLQVLWLFASRLPNGQPEVVQALALFCKTEGLRRLNAHTQNDVTQTAAIQELLDLQENIRSITARLPAGKDFIQLKSVWEEVLNASGTVAEALAKFFDQILRNNKKLDEYSQQDTAWLHRIVAGLFVPLSSKDVFEAFYKRDLAKRLLWNRCVSMDIEKHICSLFKAECGAGYTSKMEGMFQDIDLSRESMLLYKQQQQQHQPQPSMMMEEQELDMEVQILTTGYWPVYPVYPNLNLPPALKQQQELFDVHYKKKCHGRRITWQYALGHCVVRTYHFNKPYEFVLTLCQAIVLVMFSGGRTWKLPQLLQESGLEDRDEMERILQSLALGKEGTRILRKREHDGAKKIRKSIHDDDEFFVNTSFTSNQRRIRIQNIMMKETREEREKTVEGVSRDRLYLIDAALVRIMKARKTLLHQQLISQVLEQLKFPAQSSDVKKRIEGLIEREYMERDSKDRNRYNYLA